MAFDVAHGRLPRRPTQQCFFSSEQQYRKEIEDHEAHERLQPRHLDCGRVAFGIAPLAEPVGRRLEWADAPRIIEIFKWKLREEGYHDYWARIFMTDGDQVVNLVGVARISSSNTSPS